MERIYRMKTYRQNSEDINFVVFLKHKCPSCCSTLDYSEIVMKSVAVGHELEKKWYYRIFKRLSSKITFYKKWRIYTYITEKGIFDAFDKTLYEAEINLVFICPGCKRTFSVEEIRAAEKNGIQTVFSVKSEPTSGQKAVGRKKEKNRSEGKIEPQGA